MQTKGQRRRFSRIAFHGIARLLIDDHEADCMVHDLSLKGALLEVTDPSMLALVQPGTRCLLELAPDAGAAIRIEADIAHVEGARIGLVCREIALDCMTDLRHLLLLNLGDPALLDRDLATLFLP